MLGHILRENPELCEFRSPEGSFIRYKGRSYCWVNISADGLIKLSDEMLTFLDLYKGMELISIRSSDIAFTMGAKGPLVEKEKLYPGEIELF